MHSGGDFIKDSAVCSRESGGFHSRFGGAIAAASSESRPLVSDGSGQDDIDLCAIKETCHRMTDVVHRFNASLENMHPIAREYIEEMNPV